MRHVRIAVALIAVFAALAAPAVTPASDFQFAILGDRTGEAVPGVYEHVWREVAAEHPAFAITVGDTIEGGSDATASAEWLGLRPLWDRYARFPLFFAPGNHDVWSDVSAQAYTRATGRPLFYSFDWQRAHFTVLDNSRTEELDPNQLEFLERDLAANPEKGPKFIIFHRSFWLIYLKLGNPNFALHQIARRYNVTAVISGHVHQFDRLTQDGIIYLMACSSGGHLRTPDGAQDPARGWIFGHILATVRGTRVDFTLKALGAGVP